MTGGEWKWSVTIVTPGTAVMVPWETVPSWTAVRKVGTEVAVRLAK